MFEAYYISRAFFGFRSNAAAANNIYCAVRLQVTNTITVEFMYKATRAISRKGNGAFWDTDIISSLLNGRRWHNYFERWHRVNAARLRHYYQFRLPIELFIEQIFISEKDIDLFRWKLVLFYHIFKAYAIGIVDIEASSIILFSMPFIII